MRQRHAPLPLAMMAISALLLAACGGEPAKPLHEKAEKLEAPPPPKGIDATTFKLGADGNTLGFEMEAPVEKIRGRVPSTAITGEIHVDFIPGGFDNVEGKGIGVGEICTLPPLAAIANAVWHATGWRPRQTPLRPDRVLEGLRS